MTQQAADLGFAFERIPAVDGRDVPEWLRSEFSAECEMRPGVIGCYASHLVAAQMVVSRGLPFAIVLEDDAQLKPDFISIALRAVAAVPDDWDYLYLCSEGKKSVIRIGEIAPGHSLVRFTWPPANAAAYALSNRGARKWLAPMARVRPNDLDNRFSWLQNLKIYGVFPSIAVQNLALVSTIRRGGPRPRWEPSNLKMLAGQIWTMREVGLRNFWAATLMNWVNSVRKRLDGTQRIAVIGTKESRTLRRTET
ncbi:glycosyltransferase family 25 protein [Hyphomicrobium sp. 99]|uniref:glycosyltransferase family 25 protein n=1 Tax=Hyphomicrobium sp. 99 TaxID=1163419 RepID=UPI00069854BA